MEVDCQLDVQVNLQPEQILWYPSDIRMDVL
jgi:hypothetical protein